MSKTAYLFETRSIQNFIFAGGKLRDMVSASDQLDALCETPLSQVLAACEIHEDQDMSFSRRAGGAFYAVLNSAAKAKELQNLWSLYVRKHFPGIEIVQTIATAESTPEAMQAALQHMAQQRNYLSVTHPVTAPLLRRSPRTAQAVVEWDRQRHEWIDEPTRLKRAYERQERRSSLTAKFTPESHSAGDVQWPDNLDKAEGRFPFLAGDQGIAIVHADGNGIGELLMTLSEVVNHIASKTPGDDQLYTQLFKRFSDALKQATEAAAKQAMQQVFATLPGTGATLPVRPLVLGGDDLTLLIRADLALPFATTFCTAFGEQTQVGLEGLYHEVCDKLGSDHPVDVSRLKALTACAGVAFIKANQPFLQANLLAESLCGEAKAQARRAVQTKPGALIPATIAFHQVSAAMIEQLGEVRRHEWQVDIDGEHKELAMGAYTLDDGIDMPKFNTLRELAALFGKGEQKLNRNGLREVASLLKEVPAKAQQRYARWREMEQQKPGLLSKYDELLEEFGIQSAAKLPFNSHHKSPLVDLLLLTQLPQTPQGDSA